MFYSGSFTGKYKLVKVVEVHPDTSGKVRTVSIIYRKRLKKEKPEKLSKNAIVKEKVGVQRLILVQPVSNQEESDLDYVNTGQVAQSIDEVDEQTVDVLHGVVHISQEQ